MPVNNDPSLKKDNEQQEPSTGAGIGATPVAPSSGARTAAFSTGQQAGTGSGRFTNLQKYIGANQGAGDRLASGIVGKIDKQNEPIAKETQTSATAVREGIESAKNKVSVGSNYLDQVKDPTFDANSIAKDQTKLQDFTGYRTGQAIDATALANQNVNAQTNALNYQNQLQGQIQQTATDQGRYGLLKSAFGGGTAYQNPYSTGQQRLDQLFLQSGGSNGIGQLQGKLRSNVNQVGNQLNELGQATGQISQVGTQAADLAKNLQEQTTGLTNKYVTGIEGTAAEVNAKRAAEQEYFNKQYQSLQNGGNVGQRFANTLGLTQGQNLYNSLNGKNVNEFFKYGNTNLNGFGQLANTQQEDYYKSLSALNGTDPAFTLDGDPEAAAQFIAGSFDDERGANDSITADLRGRTAYSEGGNTNVRANSNVTFNPVMDQLAANQNLTYNSIMQQNPNANISEYLAVGDAIGEFTGNKLDGQTRAFVDSLRGNLNADVYANNAQFNVDQQVNGAMSNAKQNALLAALQQMQDVNYFNRVNILPDDMERTGRIS